MEKNSILKRNEEENDQEVLQLMSSDSLSEDEEKNRKSSSQETIFDDVHYESYVKQSVSNVAEKSRDRSTDNIPTYQTPIDQQHHQSNTARRRNRRNVLPSVVVRPVPPPLQYQIKHGIRIVKDTPVYTFCNLELFNPRTLIGRFVLHSYQSYPYFTLYELSFPHVVEKSFLNYPSADPYENHTVKEFVLFPRFVAKELTNIQDRETIARKIVLFCNVDEYMKLKAVLSNMEQTQLTYPAPVNFSAINEETVVEGPFPTHYYHDRYYTSNAFLTTFQKFYYNR
jgi:hypothetical protein